MRVVPAGVQAAQPQVFALHERPLSHPDHPDSVTLTPLAPCDEPRTEEWDVAVRTLGAPATGTADVKIALVACESGISAHDALQRDARQSWLAALRGDPVTGSGAMALAAPAGAAQTSQHGSTDSIRLQVCNDTAQQQQLFVLAVQCPVQS